MSDFSFFEDKTSLGDFAVEHFVFNVFKLHLGQVVKYEVVFEAS